jgi:LssY C-terminus
MRSGITWLALAGLACAVEVPSGTQMEIRLTSAVNTSTAKVDQPFDAVVIAPVVAANRIVIPAGVKLKGHVKEAKAAVNPDDQAVLALAFDQMSDARGKQAKLTARLVSVDNARESVDKDGRILGIIASQTGSGRLDQGINEVTEKYSGLGELLGTIKQAVLKETDANIDYEPGVEMTIELTKPVTWTGDTSAGSVRAVEPQFELPPLVNEQPFRTSAARPPKESDITNIMFLGSRQDLENAFQAAGWSTAEQLNSKSKLETFRAMTEQRGYKEAPVSVLFLNGRPPDLVFQKQNDTFNSRHHLRIWHRPEQFHGKEVWVCSATHDTGIDFSEENRTFVHKVDGEIDRERAKVVNDLLFTGLVKALSLVDRPAVPLSLFNATGDKIETDGKMAVVGF